MGAARWRHHDGADRRIAARTGDRLRRGRGNLEFTADELAEIDKYADEENINLWALSAEQKKGAAQR
jgi:hypothetical protein